MFIGEVSRSGAGSVVSIVVQVPTEQATPVRTLMTSVGFTAELRQQLVTTGVMSSSDGPGVTCSLSSKGVTVPAARFVNITCVGANGAAPRAYVSVSCSLGEACRGNCGRLPSRS
jgi:hypothetical protein